MAAVFFTFSPTPENQTLFEQPRRDVADFLTRQDWIQCGTDAFHSKPTYGTAKEQLLSQAKAIADIQNLIKTRPWLKERLSNTFIIIGTAFELASLLEKETRESEGCDNHEENNYGSLVRSKLHLELKTCHSFSDSKNSDKSGVRESFKSDRKRRETVHSKGENLQARNSGPTATDSKVTDVKACASAKTAATSKLQATSIIRYSADVNLNNLANKKLAHIKEKSHELMPFIPSEKTPRTAELHDWLSTFKRHYVKTFARKEKGSKRLANQTFNDDPSQQVVV